MSEGPKPDLLPKPLPKRRLIAGEAPGIGDERYLLIRSAAERIKAAMDAGFFLEATTLVESIVSERLEKRAQYVYKGAGSEAPKGLQSIKDGFGTLGRLVAELAKIDADQNLTAVLLRVRAWARERNTVIHEMVKLGDTVRLPWHERLAHAQTVAKSGMMLLCDLDEHDRGESHARRRRRYASATCPDALAPIGQPECSWCADPDGDN